MEHWLRRVKNISKEVYCRVSLGVLVIELDPQSRSVADAR